MANNYLYDHSISLNKFLKLRNVECEIYDDAAERIYRDWNGRYLVIPAITEQGL
jgi:hypothetical protein